MSGVQTDRPDRAEGSASRSRDSSGRGSGCGCAPEPVSRSQHHGHHHDRSRRDEPDSRAPVYAALDLGTNNCRLLMARPLRQGFRVIEAFSRVTRLGEGLALTGALSEEAIERTLDALEICAQRMERRGVERARLVATEACRRASNCRSFLDRVGGEIGLDIEIISAAEEARLALVGCSPLLDRRLNHALVFDIGGGSTELIRVEMNRTPGSEKILALSSLPLGVVTLAESRGAALQNREGYARTVAEMMDSLRPFAQDAPLGPLIATGQVQMLGASGTVTTLAGVHLGLQRYDRSAVDGLDMDFAAIERVTRHLLHADLPQRARHPCIGPERAELVIAGCAILEAIRRLWPVGRLRVADRGVREGVLLSMMRADQSRRWC